MYKAVNINQQTYAELHKIASQLQKPKSQIVAALVREYGKTMKRQEKSKLEKFNKDMQSKIKSLKFSKKIPFSSDNIEADFAALAPTHYIK